jgi:hypothetical protein
MGQRYCLPTGVQRSRYGTFQSSNSSQSIELTLPCVGVDGGWANLLPCPLISAPSGASSWWCGDSSIVTPCDQEGTNSNPTKAAIFSLPWNGMLPQAIMPWPSEDFTGCAVSQDNQYSFKNQLANATSQNSGGSNGSSECTPSNSDSASSSSPSSTPNTTVAQRDCPNGAQIGEGVAIGVISLIALGMAIWALRERKEKKKFLAAAGLRHNGDGPRYQQNQPDQYYDNASKGPMTPAPGYQSAVQRPPVSEMDSFGNGRPPAHEMGS